MNERSEVLSNSMNEDNKSGCNDASCCPPQSPVTRSAPKVGRNDPCVCGSERKFKKCCGKNT